MKSSTINLFTNISKTDLKSLTAEVKETIATFHVSKPVFTAAELWSVQRKFKTTRSRRSF